MSISLKEGTFFAVGCFAALACGESGTRLALELPEPELEFSVDRIQIGPDAAELVLLENRGGRTADSVRIPPAPVSVGATVVPTAYVQATPSEILELAPGATARLTVTLVSSQPLEAGEYSSALEARAAGVSQASLAVGISVPAAPPGTDGSTVEITDGPATPQQGDVVAYAAESRDASGALISDPEIVWSVIPSTAGLITGEGRFVGYAPGPAKIVAATPGAQDTLDVVIAPRGLAGSFAVVGHGAVGERFTSDLWVAGDFAYTGTWSCRGTSCGDRLNVWDVSDPASPVLTGVVIVDARTVNDIKVRSDGELAVLTHEGSLDGLNGITLLDLSNPGQPEIISRYTSGLEAGVHNVWIDGDHVYVAVHGGVGLRILDISNPQQPRNLAGYHAGLSILHDIYVRDGLAFLSHWNAGLVILDVGNGIAGGSPTNPVEVSRIVTEGGETHNAWYWPATGYVLVGEEDFSAPGRVHVVDASDLARPMEVATFRLAGATPHNFWLDEERGILYVGWYDNGLRAIDVSGELLGELDRQGRAIAASVYDGGGECSSGVGTCTWAPQLHRGVIYLSDLNTGLWVLNPSF